MEMVNQPLFRCFSGSKGEGGGASEVDKIEKPHCSGECETLIWCDLYQIRNKSDYSISELS